MMFFGLIFAILITISFFIFFTCTLPGFMHITKLHKVKGIPLICLALGTLFLINLIYKFLLIPFAIILYTKKEKCSKCKCGKNCKCKKNCDCNKNKQ